MLYKDLPKVAGIAVDLFFDHLLAKTWEMHHVQEYQTFLNDFYHHNSEIENDLTLEFKQFITIFRDRKWLNHYPTDFGLAKSCEGVSKRISFTNKLAEAPEIFYKLENEIQAVFHKYMLDAKTHFAKSNSVQ